MLFTLQQKDTFFSVNLQSMLAMKSGRPYAIMGSCIFFFTIRYHFQIVKLPLQECGKVRRKNRNKNAESTFCSSSQRIQILALSLQKKWSNRTQFTSYPCFLYIFIFFVKIFVFFKKFTVVMQVNLSNTHHNEVISPFTFMCTNYAK